MSDETKEKPGEYLIGLALGTAVAAGAWFLYKTKKGKRLRCWWEKYFNELKDEWEKMKQKLPPPAKKPVRRRRKPASNRHLFLQSGKPLR